jgi:diacylglycerol kinase family enzyme
MTVSTFPTPSLGQGRILGSLTKELRCAALLNANARKVNTRVKEQIQRLLPGDVFMTRTQEEADSIVNRLIDEEYDIIFAGGGDGTIAHLINSLAAKLEERGMDPSSDGPLVGLLPLGTGNALAAHFGITSAVGDLGLLTNGAPMRARPLRMLRSGNKYFPFAGVGIDGVLLSDYISIKKSVQDTVLEPFITGATGYAAATFRTICRAMKPIESRPNITITNTGDRAYRVSARTGEILDVYESGETLYTGHALIASASTIRCYGFNLQLFPVAEARQDRFQLRVFDGPVSSPAMRIPKIFSGTYEADGLYDFLADGIHVAFDTKAPYQIAGDAMGAVDELSWKLSSRVIPIAVPDRGRLH